MKCLHCFTGILWIVWLCSMACTPEPSGLQLPGGGDTSMLHGDAAMGDYSRENGDHPPADADLPGDDDIAAQGDLDLNCPAGYILDDEGRRCILLSAWEQRAEPDAAGTQYVPGEYSYAFSTRPDNWAIEWSGNEGLDFGAYRSAFRAPYIQRITPHSAVILWRVNSELPLEQLSAELTYAPAQVPFEQGVSLSIDNGITASYRYDTYRYEDGVTLEAPWIENGGSDFWLNGLYDRPIVEFRAQLEGLQPGTVYHYRLRSDAADPDGFDLLSAEYLLADDVSFMTAPVDGQATVRFFAVGDVGPGDGRPSYFYDVFDLMHHAARRYGPQLWLALGDLDNDSDGHPNAVDPFFFNVYNAFVGQLPWDSGYPTSNHVDYELTDVRAFGRPPYYGLLGGLPVFPTFGNHDICTGSDSSAAYFNKAYLGNFVLPDNRQTGFEQLFIDAANTFNADSGGYYYTFRYGNVIFISLGLPRETCALGNGEDWYGAWGLTQMLKLERYLSDIAPLLERPDVWCIAYFHDHNNLDADPMRAVALEHGIDLLIAGHDHSYRDFTVVEQPRSYQALIAGTGGFGDQDAGDQCRRPGFVMLQVRGNLLEYWKFDTHPTDAAGEPMARDTFNPSVREYRKIRKEGLGIHRIFADQGSSPYVFE